DELTEQQAGVALLVSPFPRHLLGIPPVEYAAVLGNDETDPPGKTALLGLDQMSEHLQDAPLIRAGPEREHATRQSGVLATDRIHGGREERHDLAGGEWSGWCGHRRYLLVGSGCSECTVPPNRRLTSGDALRHARAGPRPAHAHAQGVDQCLNPSGSSVSGTWALPWRRTSPGPGSRW